MFEDIIEERLKTLGLPVDIDPAMYTNLQAMVDTIIARYRDNPAFTSLGRTITYGELDTFADAFAGYLQQHTPLQPGDRIAIQLPNIIQYPVALIGALRAGLIVVNTNPLYTEPELQHQFNDAGAKALVVLANVASTAANVLAETDVETVIVTELADLHPTPKRQLTNYAVKYVKRMVPAFSIPGAVRFVDVINQGKCVNVQRMSPQAEDVAVLQYTGGTTGVAKGAMLTHSNIIANTLQTDAIFDTYGLGDQGPNIVQPLPLYHIYALIISFIVMNKGGHTVLIPNPRDVPGLVKELGKWQFQSFCGLNTLFIALCNEPAFRQLDFSSLKMTLSGGMALTHFAAEQWETITGCPVFEGYGLTEASPIVSANSGNGQRIGTIGVPLPSTEIEIRDDQDQRLGIGEVGELCIRGPQVMKGYWQREQATADTIKDGWLYSGDIATLDEQGYLTIVDRKKDMIIVSGFNVYPIEIEDVITSHPDILEAAVIGHDDPTSGEVVHAYVVKATDNVTADDLISHCRQNLTGYKVPKRVVFMTELPKTNVGKVLRRSLREGAC